MSEKFARYYQKCDFCHQELEVTVSGMMKIALPGYFIGCEGQKVKAIVEASICGDCLDRIRAALSEKVDIKEVAYCGVAIDWKPLPERSGGEENES